MSSKIDIAAQTVELAQRSGATESDAWLQTSQHERIDVHDGAVEQLRDTTSRVLVLRTFVGQHVATVYSADLSTDGLTRLASQGVELARLLDPDPYAGLPDRLAAGFDAGSLRLYDETLFEQSLEALGELARRAEAAARDADPRITNSERLNISRRRVTTMLANSRGFAGSYLASDVTLNAGAVADDADQKKRNGAWSTSARFLAQLEDPETVGSAAAQRALRQLGARTLQTQEAPVVWPPVMAAYFVEMVANAARGEALSQGTTFLIGQESQRVGAPSLTIVDDPTIPAALGTRPFDDEGVAPQRVALFEAGVFGGFLFDSYHARRNGRTSTGHATRIEARNGFAVGIQTSNLSLVPGERTPESILSEVQRGLYLTELVGVSLNQTTGDLSLGAVGLWIEGGSLTYPVSEITIAGRLPNLLANIDAIGNDTHTFGTISAPTVRIARMTISGR